MKIYIFLLIMSYISSCAWIEKAPNLKVLYNPKDTSVFTNDLNYYIEYVKIDSKVLLYESLLVKKDTFKVFSDLNDYLKPINLRHVAKYKDDHKQIYVQVRSRYYDDIIVFESDPSIKRLDSTIIFVREKRE
ncbi:hypothetical protein AD998_08785 [bacterium 336/3]|nr:hypothetical protein AD998_08785 [bacterium 336/3]